MKELAPKPEKKKLRIAKVTFGQQTIPHYMKVGVKKISIQEELPKPMQCRICLKFEHTHKRCPNKEDLKEKRCFKCGKEGHHDDVALLLSAITAETLTMHFQESVLTTNIIRKL